MTGASSPAIWQDPTPLLVLGTGAALPGKPIATEALLEAVDRRFGLSLRRPGVAIANKLGIRTRHCVVTCRCDWKPPGEGTVIPNSPQPPYEARSAKPV